MSKPTEKVKTSPTRKRLLYEVSQKNAPKSEAPQLSAAVVIETVAEVTTETVVSDNLSATTSIESHKIEPLEKSENVPKIKTHQEDKGASWKLQESHAVRELSAIEIAEMEFEADKAVSNTAAATTFVESSGEESKKRALDEQFHSAMTTVRTYSAMSAATGLIPMPLVDMAGLMTIQLLMLKKLSKHYSIPFDSQRSKSAIAILVSGINSGYIAASSSKLIPFIGVFSMAAMPVVNCALSYAVGRVFIKHFASGGTFLDFDPVKARDYFGEQFRKLVS